MIAARCVSSIKASKHRKRLSPKILNDQLKNINDKDNLIIVDLSYSGLRLLPNEIYKVSHLIKHLILDGNLLDEYCLNSCYFSNLESLSLNSNNIKNIGVLLQVLKRQAPNILFLSLIDNPGWPHPITCLNNVELYEKYCKMTVKFFPKLLFLDSLKLCN